MECNAEWCRTWPDPFMMFYATCPFTKMLSEWNYYWLGEAVDQTKRLKVYHWSKVGSPTWPSKSSPIPRYFQTCHVSLKSSSLSRLEQTIVSALHDGDLMNLEHTSTSKDLRDCKSSGTLFGSNCCVSGRDWWQHLTNIEHNGNYL